MLEHTSKSLIEGVPHPNRREECPQIFYLSAKKPVICPVMVPEMVERDPIQATLEKNSSTEFTATILLNLESGEFTESTIPITDENALYFGENREHYSAIKQ